MDATEHRQQFTDLQWATLDYVELGMNLTQACRKAGYKDPKQMAIKLRQLPYFREEMNLRHGRNRDVMKMTRDKVQEMVMEAYEIAKLTTDANAMVRAASEINKMCGFYEVEKAQIELSNSQKDFVNRLNELSDDELIAMTAEASKINPALEQQVEEEHLENIIEAEWGDTSGD